MQKDSDPYVKLQQCYNKKLFIIILFMGVKENKQPKSKHNNMSEQSSDSEGESNETMPIFALGNLSLDERALSGETVAPEGQQHQHPAPHEISKCKPIKKRGGRPEEGKEKLKQRIGILNRKIEKLQEELSTVRKQEDSCPHCHFYLNQPKTTSREHPTPDESRQMDCFKRSTSRDSIQFQQIDFAAPLMYSSEMEEKSWIFLGTVLIAMGSKVLDIDGTVNVFKIVKESVDRIRRQVEKSEQKLSMDFFLAKQELQVEHRMDELSFDPFFQKEEYRGGLQLQSVRVESVEEYDLYFDQKLTFNVKYDALITIMEYMKENSNISFT